MSANDRPINPTPPDTVTSGQANSIIRELSHGPLKSARLNLTWSGFHAEDSVGVTTAFSPVGAGHLYFFFLPPHIVGLGQYFTSRSRATAFLVTSELAPSQEFHFSETFNQNFPTKLTPTTPFVNR
jgi:hypothetical protein